MTLPRIYRIFAVSWVELHATGYWLDPWMFGHI